MWMVWIMSQSFRGIILLHFMFKEIPPPPHLERALWLGFIFRRTVSGVLLQCKYRLFPYIRSSADDLCRVEGCTWETQRCQRATLEIGRQMKKIPRVSWFPLTLFLPFLFALHNAFGSFREGIYPSSLNECVKEFIRRCPKLCVRAFVSSLLLLGLCFHSPTTPPPPRPPPLPPSSLQVLAIPSPHKRPSRFQRGCISLNPRKVAVEEMITISEFEGFVLLTALISEDWTYSRCRLQKMSGLCCSW